MQHQSDSKFGCQSENLNYPVLCYNEHCDTILFSNFNIRFDIWNQKLPRSVGTKYCWIAWAGVGVFTIPCLSNVVLIVYGTDLFWTTHCLLPHFFENVGVSLKTGSTVYWKMFHKRNGRHSGI